MLEKMVERFELNLVKNCVQVINYRTASHQLGQSVLSPDNEFCYINIPKNASSTMSAAFRGWKQVDFRELGSNTKFIVVLRDPTERWISAVAEFLVGKQSGLGKITKITEKDVQQIFDSELIKNWIFTSIYLDSHSLPQCYFLQGLNIDRAKFFFQDIDLTRKISEYVKVDIAKNINTASSDPLKLLVVDHLTNIISKNSDIAKSIDIHYWADHQLFDNIRFEN